MFAAEASFASWFDLNKRGQEERPEHDRAALSPAGSPWMQSYLHRKIEVRPLEEQGYSVTIAGPFSWKKCR